ncbi:MAG: tetratricopeptide repeat protein [Anaerolineae bacterium]|nr:tetratricopeptide repeat protein [Anaerolineae bacterium]
MAYADLCLEVGKPVEAIKAIKQQLPDESIGDNKRVLDKLSAAYLAAEEYDNAIRAAMICSDKFGTSSDNLWILAQANQANNNLPETIKALRQLVRLDPMHEEGILLLANLLSMTGVPEDALATLEKAVSAHENSLAIQQERCKLIWRLHGVHKVIPILKNLVARHPDSSEISTMLAEAMEQAGDLSGAESIATAGLKKNPAITELNAIMGRIQYRAGQLDRAISYLSEAIRQSPGTLQNYLDLANVYLDRREPLQALRVYQSAIRAIPNDPQAYLEAAKILKDCRDYIGAETMLRKAAELSPEDVNIRRQLGAIIALNLVHHAKEVGSPS